MAEEAQVVEASDEIKFSEEELKELGELQASETMLTQKLPVASILLKLSFGSSTPTLEGPDPKPIIGGLSCMPLKKEYGARLLRPSLSIVEIHAIGLGATIALNGLYFRPWSLTSVV